MLLHHKFSTFNNKNAVTIIYSHNIINYYFWLKCVTKWEPVHWHNYSVCSLFYTDCGCCCSILLFLSDTDLLALSFISFNESDQHNKACEKRVLIKNHRKRKATTYCCNLYVVQIIIFSPYFKKEKKATHQVFDSTRVFTRKRQIFNCIFDHL